MNFLVSGGWGYGNLGDDALLLSTIDLIKSKYPKASITIMTYSTFDTSKLLTGTNIKVVPSVHRLIYGNRAYKQLRVYGKSFNIEFFPFLLYRIFNKFRNIINSYFSRKSSNFVTKFKRSTVKYANLSKIFNDADFFIMSGGGYFNNWDDSFNSRLLEIELAANANLPIYIIGQTLGPFSEEKKVLLQNVLNKVSAIYVRDYASFRELDSMGFTSILAPDLALSYIPPCHTRVSRIAIVPAEIPFNKRIAFFQSIARLIECTSLPVMIIVTRLYNPDIVCAHDLYSYLKSRACVDVSLCISTNFFEISEHLSNSEYVISRNLHGLILGWRGGAKCICLCNERKFVSFMHQINADDYIVDMEGDIVDQILECFMKTKFLDEQVQHNRHVNISKEIICAFNNVLSIK